MNSVPGVHSTNPKAGPIVLSSPASPAPKPARCSRLTAALILVCSLIITQASATELDDRQREITQAAETLANLTPGSEPWRTAHGAWLLARLRRVSALSDAGQFDTAKTELSAIEKDLIRDEVPRCRIGVLEARIAVVLRAPDAWENSRELLNQAERIAASRPDSDLPLLALNLRANTAIQVRQYDDALQALKRLRQLPVLKTIDAKQARFFLAQTRVYEAVASHFMGLLTGAKEAGLAGLRELEDLRDVPGARALEGQLRSRLAVTFLALEDYEEALRNATLAVSVLRDHKNDHACADALASAHTTRAAVQVKRGGSQEARKIRADFAAAMDLYEQRYGPSSAYLIPQLTTQGLAFTDLDDLDAADAALERALNLAESNHLPRHLRLPLLTNRCRLRLRQQRPEEARAIAVQMRQIWQDYLPVVLAAGSESERLNLLRECQWVDSALACRSPQPTEEENREAARAIIATYGVVFDSLMNDAARMAHQPRDQQLRYQQSRSRLAALALNLGASAASASNTEVTALLDTLRDLSSSRAPETPSANAVEQMQKALPEGSALVVFSPYRTMDGRTGERLAAALLRPDAINVVTFAAPRDVIRSVADDLEEALKQDSQDEVQRLIDDLKAGLWQPLQEVLGTTQHLFLCLDAAMQRVPVTIWDHPRVTFLTSPQALLRQAPASASSPAASSGSWLLINAGTQRLRFETGLSFPYDITDRLKDHSLPLLPGATNEIAALSNDQPQRWDLLRSDTPTGDPEESAFVAQVADPPAVIHFAGHAIMRDPEVESASAASQWWEGVGQPRALWCSSLLFSNPQPATQADDLGTDNFLFAAEIAGLDLKGTQLVTLSACQTGAGFSPKNEVNYSLARAFHTAGVRDVISCTNAMPDAPAVKLMAPFYQRLAKGDDAAQAFWEEQHKVIQANDTASLRAFGFLRLTRAWVASPQQ